MDLTKKLKRVMLELDITQLELARRTKQSQANMSQKMSTNNYKISEYERLVNALGCELEVNIILPNGQKL